MSTTLAMAWLILAAGAMSAEPIEKPTAPPVDPRVKAVIDEVEFDVNPPWGKRDAVEISVVPKSS